MVDIPLKMTIARKRGKLGDAACQVEFHSAPGQTCPAHLQEPDRRLHRKKKGGGVSICPWLARRHLRSGSY
jgi:hypothetical protein